MRKSILLAALFAAIFAVPVGAVYAGALHDAARQGDITAITELLEGGADINEFEILTPLQMAAFSGHVDAVELLVNHGANLEDVSPTLGTALHAAANRGHGDVVRALLRAGSDPNSRNEDQYTPLMIAALNEHLDVVNALIEIGADIDAIGVAKRSPKGGHGNVNALHLATFIVRFDSPKRDTEVAKALRAAGAGPRLIPIDENLMAQSDPELGRELTVQRCGGCHKIESEVEVVTQPDMGQSLVGIFGSPVASREDAEYSDTLKNFGGVWTKERLYSFIAEPMLTIPGNRMRWQGGWTEDQVAHMVAYFISVAK